jgi:hypothetical protein
MQWIQVNWDTSGHIITVTHQYFALIEQLHIKNKECTQYTHKTEDEPSLCLVGKVLTLDEVK